MAFPVITSLQPLLYILWRDTLVRTGQLNPSKRTVRAKVAAHLAVLSRNDAAKYDNTGQPSIRATMTLLS